MAQISLYVDDAMIVRLNAVAKAHNCSISKYVAAVVSESLSREDSEKIMKLQLLTELQGSISDTTFVAPLDIPWESELPRRFDLL
ncbi:MAG: hypothetical protein FWC75_04635 [Oscillospiraceae bacterium]|nr:hypothetical protein [Oscillospiraceae bacterium]